MSEENFLNNDALPLVEGEGDLESVRNSKKVTLVSDDSDDSKPREDVNALRESQSKVKFGALVQSMEAPAEMDGGPDADGNPVEVEVAIETEAIAVDSEITPSIDVEGAVDGEIEVVDANAAAAEGEATVVDGETAVIEGEAVVVDGEIVVMEGETAEVEGETAVIEGKAIVDGDTSAIVDGEKVAIEGEAVIGEGETIAIEGEAAVIEGEEIVVEAEAAVEDGEGVVDETKVVEEEGGNIEGEEEMKGDVGNEGEMEYVEDLQYPEDISEEPKEERTSLRGSVTDVTFKTGSVIRKLSEQSVVIDVAAKPELAPEKSKFTVLDREFWRETYKQLLSERAQHQRKNVILQRRLHEHYKKRKLFHVFTVNEPVSSEMEAKYIKRLHIYNEVRNLELSERLILTHELQDLQQRQSALEKTVKEEFERLVEVEREVGKSLIDPKTYKPLDISVVERYLRLQKTKAEELNRYRLTDIKLQDHINEIDNAMEALEKLGDGLYMVDYEQLRIENQNLSEKIEEREDEVIKLRNESKKQVQVVAHLKEKSYAILSAVDKKNSELKDQEEDLDYVRNQVSKLKQARTKVRADFTRESEAAGLLTKPKLLRDFEESLDKAAEMSAEVESLRDVCAIEQQRLGSIKRSIVLGQKEPGRSIDSSVGDRKLTGNSGLGSKSSDN